MVNLTTSPLAKRPASNETAAMDVAAASESSSPSSPSKNDSKFADHLVEAPLARANPKPAPKPSLARDAKQTLRSPEANAGVQAPKTMKSPIQNPEPIKTDAAPDRTLDLSRDKPAAKNDNDDKKVDLKTKNPKAKLAGVEKATTETKPSSREAGSVLVIQADDIPASNKAELDAASLDLSNEEGEPWEKRLEDMLLFMGIQPASLQQELPALAILTGQLQFVEPEAIPSTLAQSPMLGNALASANPEELVNQVKPLGAWLDEMGWSPDGLVVQDPAAFQDLMNTPVSLKDLMKTFQVDPNKVVAEAKNLQATLPIDGAKDLQARSKSMKADSSLPQATGKVRSGAEKGEGEANPMEAEFLNVILGASANTSLAGQTPADATTGLTPKAKETAPIKTEAAPTLASLDQMLASMMGGAPVVDGMPKAMVTGDNPFQSMELRSSETFVFKADAAPGEAPTQMPRGDAHAWLEGIQALALRSETPEAQGPDSARAFDPSLLLERMTEVTLGGAADFNQSGSDEKSDEGLQETHDHFTGMMGPSSNNKTTGTFTLATGEAQKTQAPREMQKAVFDNASMLVKDGGGSIRIDVGNKEIGAVDLAVEVKDNVVEIKIVAASPQAREMLATELPKLKESLQQQNLNLSRVEIGLSGGSAWTSSDGRSSQRETSQESEIFGVNGAGRKSSKSYRQQVSSTQSLQPQVITDGGSIKVRV